MSETLGPSITSSSRLHLLKKPWILLVLSVVIFAGAILVLLGGSNELRNVPESIRDFVNVQPEKVSLNDLQLIDHHNAPFTEKLLAGRWSFILFGYTNCPDVCPTTLMELDDLAVLLKDKNKKPKDVQFIFVTIDPKRDTAKELESYLAYFDAGYIGVTGSEQELRKFADQVGVTFSYTKLPGVTYAVSHSSHMVLIDPKGRYLAHFPAPHYSADLRDWFSEIKKLPL